MIKWEYIAVYYETIVDVSIINQLGNDGWELIQIVIVSEDMKNPRWIFKREKIGKVKPDDEDLTMARKEIIDYRIFIHKCRFAENKQLREDSMDIMKKYKSQ